MRPSRHALAALAVLALAAALAAGCAGPRPGPEHAAVSPPSAVAPGDELERELLRRLPELPAEQPVSIDDATVIAQAPYFAASGRTCRALTIRGPGRGPGAAPPQASSQASPAPSPATSGDASATASGGASRSRLACREDGDWFFVPQIFRSAVPDASDRP
jgi:hypothetical protein